MPKHPDSVVSHETMVKLLAGRLGPYRLLDARSADEYAGTYTGYDYIPLAGRIPTAESAVNGDYQVSATENLKAVLVRLANTFVRKGIRQQDRIFVVSRHLLAGVPDVRFDPGLWIHERGHPRWGLERMASTTSQRRKRETIGD